MIDDKDLRVPIGGVIPELKIYIKPEYVPIYKAKEKGWSVNLTYDGDPTLALEIENKRIQSVLDELYSPENEKQNEKWRQEKLNNVSKDIHKYYAYKITALKNKQKQDYELLLIGLELDLLKTYSEIYYKEKLLQLSILYNIEVVDGKIYGGYMGNGVEVFDDSKFILTNHKLTIK